MGTGMHLNEKAIAITKYAYAVDVLNCACSSLTDDIRNHSTLRRTSLEKSLRPEFIPDIFHNNRDGVVYLSRVSTL